MNKDGWKKLVIKAVNDETSLDMLTQLLEEADEAKQALRDKGYGYLGLSLLKTVQQEVPLASLKVLALLGGGDWADASVCHLVKLTVRSINDLNEEYQKEGSYHGTRKWFMDWLIQKGYCREADEKDLEIFD